MSAIGTQKREGDIEQQGGQLDGTEEIKIYPKLERGLESGASTCDRM